MVKKNTGRRVSSVKSFEYWNIWEFFKGQKKPVTAVIISLLAMILSQEEAAVITGPIITAIWSITAFYYKKKVMH